MLDRRPADSLLANPNENRDDGVGGQLSFGHSEQPGGRMTGDLGNSRGDCLIHAGPGAGERAGRPGACRGADGDLNAIRRLFNRNALERIGDFRSRRWSSTSAEAGASQPALWGDRAPRGRGPGACFSSARVEKLGNLLWRNCGPRRRARIPPRVRRRSAGVFRIRRIGQPPTAARRRAESAVSTSIGYSYFYTKIQVL